MSRVMLSKRSKLPNILTVTTLCWFVSSPLQASSRMNRNAYVTQLSVRVPDLIRKPQTQILSDKSWSHCITVAAHVPSSTIAIQGCHANPVLVLEGKSTFEDLVGSWEFKTAYSYDNHDSKMISHCTDFLYIGMKIAFGLTSRRCEEIYVVYPDNASQGLHRLDM